MAKLRIEPQMLYHALFGGMTPLPNVQIVGGSFNSQSGLFEIYIEGPDLPEANEVVAIVTIKSSTVEFKAV